MLVSGVTKRLGRSIWEHRLLVIFSIALSLRLIFLAFSVDQVGLDGFWSLSPDTNNYMKVARDLLDGTDLAENYLLSFGPGYPVFLALNEMVFGHSAVSIILVQVLLSCLSCLLIYRLSMKITGSEAVSLVASLMVAISYTSISLSIMILSDTLFFFMFLSGLLLYLHALDSGRWSYFLSCGVLFSFAVLVRSIGQMWPAGMLLIALPWIIKGSKLGLKPKLNRPLLARLLVCLAIIVAIEGLWVLRNIRVNDVPVLTSASYGGPANVAAFACELMTGVPYREIRANWHHSFAEDNNLTAMTYRDDWSIDVTRTKAVLQDHPIEFIKAYFLLTWENLTAVNSLPRIQLPEFRRPVMDYEYWWRDRSLNRACLVLSLLGLVLMLIRREFVPALLLATVYFYFASMVGFTRWQGSRLFLPGMIAWSILISALFVGLGDALKRAIMSLASLIRTRQTKHRPLNARKDTNG